MSLMKMNFQRKNEDGDDYPFNEEEIAEGIQAQEDSYDQPNNISGGEK